MREILGLLLLYLGLALAILGVVGLFRFPDVYTRIKAMAMVNGIGAISVHLSSAFLTSGASGARGILTAFFFLLSGPALSQVILLAAHRLKESHVHKLDDLTKAEMQEGREGRLG